MRRLWRVPHDEARGDDRPERCPPHGSVHPCAGRSPINTEHRCRKRWDIELGITEPKLFQVVPRSGDLTETKPARRGPCKQRSIRLSSVRLTARLLSTMATTSSSLLFDDIFTISAIDKEGKKFDRGSATPK